MCTYVVSTKYLYCVSLNLCIALRYVLLWDKVKNLFVLPWDFNKKNFQNDDMSK